MDPCCASTPGKDSTDSSILQIDSQLQNDLAEKLDQNFVSLFLQHILSNSSLDCFEQCLQANGIDKKTVNQNLNLCSIVFPEDDDDNVTCMDTIVPNHNQMSPFHFAVYKGQIDSVRFLLDKYEPEIESECTLILDQIPVRGISALWMAVSLTYTELVLLLLEYGADINHSTKSQSTPLRVACFDGHHELVQLLIEQGADVNIPNKFQNTCLMLSCYMGNDRIAHHLIDASADMDRQALCGATALHFAAQQGHGTILKLLLYHGAKFLPNNHGFTPLFVAAENTQTLIVQQIFAVPNLTTFEERIAACELLGASYATTIDRLGNYNFIHEAFVWLKNAFILRYSANLATDSDRTCKGINDLKLPPEADPNQIPSIAKPCDTELMSTYFFHKECQTLAELESIQTNSMKMLSECFVILERVLGPKNLTLAEALVIRGAEFADIGQFAHSCLLWLRAIQIKINAKVFIGEDCLRFIRVLERMVLERSSYCEYIEQLLLLGIEYYSLRPRLFGYRKLCYRINLGNLDEFEDFTFNDLKRDLSPVLKYNTNLDIWNKLDSDLDSDQVMLSQLYLCSLVAKYIHEFDPEMMTRLRKLIHRLCKLNITQNITGRTLLHLAMSTEPDEEFHFNNRFNNVLIRYPSVITAQFLIRCGADVTATDIAYNTPLHYLSAFAIRDSEAKTEHQYQLYNLMVSTEMSSLDQLVNFSPKLSLSSLSSDPMSPVDIKPAIFSKCSPYYGGEYSVHMDAVNIFGQTPMQSSTSLLSDIIFGNTKQVYSLKCFAARAVHQKYLFCNTCKNKTGKFELERLWSDNPSPNQRYIKLLRYNQILANNLKVPKAKYRFSYLDKYRSHNVVDYCQHHIWNKMNHFADKLSISLELAQFVEMHGPCKFLHFPLAEDSTDPNNCLKS